MGYYLQVGLEEAVSLASIIGWGDVIRWSQTLHPDKSQAIRHLCIHGWEQDLDDLTAELTAALKSDPPRHDVESTVQEMLKNIKARPSSAAVVSVTDGMGPEDAE